MGLMLRYYLFRCTTAPAVFGMLHNFYAACARPLQHAGTEAEQIDVHEADNDWVVVALDSGWEWIERRAALRFISQRLACVGLLVFVYDGDYWGYELVDKGVILDQFTQEQSDIPISFPNKPTQGNARIVAEALPFLQEADIAAYLVQKQDWSMVQTTTDKARLGDQYNRFDECAVLDFLRMLGVDAYLQNDYVHLISPLYRSAWKKR